MAKSKYIDRDNLYSDRMDADSGGEEFMGGQAEPAGGIAGLPPEIAAAIAQLMSAQAAGAPAEVAPGMVAGEAAGIPELLAQSDNFGSAAAPTAREMMDGVGKDGQVAALSQTQTGALPAEVAPAMAAGKGAGIAELLAAPAATAPLTTTRTTTEAYNAAKTAADRALRMAVKREPVDLRYDINKDGKVTSADALSLSKGTPIRFDIDAFGAKPTTTDVGALSTNRVTESSAPVSAPAAPVAASQAPTAKEIRDGVGKDGQVAALSQTQGYGMVPVYQAQQGRGADRGEPVLMGYEFNPIAAGLTTVDTPKPAAILAEEKRLGKEMEPTYATYTAPQEGSDRGNRESIAYGPPTGYRYDNGQSQYVKFDSSGNYYETEQRKGEFDDALKAAALFAAISTGGASLGLGAAGAGAGAAGTAAAAFTPEMIAAGLAPGSIGAAGAASGALTGANLAAASGIGSLGAGALTGAAGTAALPASEVASLSNALPSVNEMIASGMSPGSAGAAGAASGALTPAQLAAAAGASGTGITSLAPVAKSVNEMVASGMSPGSAGASGAASGALTGAELAAASGATGTGVASLAPAAKSVNEMIASGTGAGSAGAAGAASGALTPAELAAASGVVTEGATPALFEAGRAGKGLTSANEAVASGLGPGSAGAKAAVDGTLTAQELAAAAGTTVIAKDGTGDLLTKAKDAITDKVKDKSSGSGMGLGGALGLMALMSMMNKGGGAAPASTATIPELTATRSQLPYDVDKKGVNPNTPYRPGQGGVTYFSPTTYTPTPAKAAGGGLMSLGQSNLGSYSDGGRLLKGPGDGVSDSIPAIIGRKQPARLANGEFVIPARIVSELGNGSTDAGAKRLYEMMARVQKARRNTKNVAANTKAAKYLPA